MSSYDIPNWIKISTHWGRTFKSSYPHIMVQTDQGSKLGKSDSFANIVANCGLSLKLTWKFTSAQNWIAKNKNKNSLLFLTTNLKSIVALLFRKHFLYDSFKKCLPKTSSTRDLLERLRGLNIPPICSLRYTLFLASQWKQCWVTSC